MLGALARKIFGSAYDRRLKGYAPKVAAINALEAEVAALSDEALRARTQEFRDQIAAGRTLDELLVPAFATVREAARLLAISEGNVKVRLLRARLALRERLTRVFGREGGGILPAHPHEGRRSTSAQALLRNYQRRGKVKP